MHWFKKRPTAIKNMSIKPPTADRDRRGLAIAVCVKDEAVYIEEWVRFHLSVGVCHFIVYDNGSNDGTSAVLRRVLAKTELTIIPWAGRISATKSEQVIDGQVLAFAHAILNFGARFQRMAFIDVDEFLLPKSGRTVLDALEKVGSFPNISLPWHMFGTSGHKAKPPGGVLTNYTRRAANPIGGGEPASNFKCIVDPCEVTDISVHQFKTKEFGELTSNDAGKRTNRKGRKEKSFYSNDFLQLNHYYTKSEEEMQAKIARGWTYARSNGHVGDKMKTTVRAIEANEIEDLAMIEFLQNRDAFQEVAE